MIKTRDTLADDAVEMSLTQNKDVIQTLAPHTANEPFADRIGSRCFHRCFEDLDLTVLGYSSEASSVLLVIVSDQKAG